MIESVKDWLYYCLQDQSPHGTKIRDLVLERFFLATKVLSIRKEISIIKQERNKILHEYWEYYKKLVASCSTHEITLRNLNLHFYEGLLPLERRITDAVNGGAISEIEPEDGKNLISKMAINSR